MTSSPWNDVIKLSKMPILAFFPNFEELLFRVLTFVDLETLWSCQGTWRLHAYQISWLSDLKLGVGPRPKIAKFGIFQDFANFDVIWWTIVRLSSYFIYMLAYTRTKSLAKERMIRPKMCTCRVRKVCTCRMLILAFFPNFEELLFRVLTSVDLETLWSC